MARSNTNRNQTENDAPESREYKEIFGAVPRGKRSFWTRIGVAFENKDGSWNLLFDFVPTSTETTIQLRDPKARDERDEE